MGCSHLFTGNFSPVLNRNRGTSFHRHRLISRPNLFLRPPSTSLSVQGGLGSFTNLDFKFPIPHIGCGDNGGGYNGNNNGGGSDRGGGFGDSYNNGGGGGNNFPFTDLGFILFLSCVLSSLFFFTGYAHAIASTEDKWEGEREPVWEVKGSKWIQLIPDNFRDEFVSATSSLPFSSFLTLDNFLSQCKTLLSHFLLPEGFPNSVSSDYLDYSLWRGVQGIASQISGVLATQSLLYAVGLGKGAIPTAAAINWVLKDGIGYLGKIVLSKYGRHFDVHPKGWRLFADLLENAAFGLEMLTPVFPQFFVVIGATAGAGRSAASLIQAATRSCFYAGFAARRNFAEVIAKGEAQGMVSKAVGIMLGIGVANCIGTSTSLMLASFTVVTCIHMYTNLKSYQCIQLRTLNPYRASLVFSEYLRSGQAPSIKDVNDEEPLFPDVPNLNIRSTNKMQPISLSSEARDAAAEIEQRLQLGSKLSDVVNNKEDAFALFNLYRDEGYILTEHKGKFCVVLKESSTPQDMLKSLFQVNYLYWLEKNVGIDSGSLFIDCKPGGRLHISLDNVQRELDIVKTDSQSVGWLTDGLIARPLPTRVRPCFITSSTTS